jgi:hypothetical protein
MKSKLLAILLGTIWISLSEFVRNEFLLKHLWSEHYSNMGLVFPAEPMNGAVWGIWSLCFAVIIAIISEKYSLLQTTMLSWLLGFVLMWLVIGNLGVLPFKTLPYAIPLSILEAFVASWIMFRIRSKR